MESAIVEYIYIYLVSFLAHLILQYLSISFYGNMKNSNRKIKIQVTDPYDNWVSVCVRYLVALGNSRVHG